MSIGWVKGNSMWPNLVNGDILSAEGKPVSDLRPGMIAVFSETDGSNPVVHRVKTIRNRNDRSFVTTAGDNSGNDISGRIVRHCDSVSIVTGVLRMGRYRKITKFVVPPPANKRFFATVVSRIVKFLFW